MTSYLKSPFNYTGGKYKLLKQIIPLFPERIENFIDLFSGGCNVGININSTSKKFIDYNKNLMEMLNVFKDFSRDEILNAIDEVIKKYELSDTTINGYEYYGCNSSDGLASYNREKYNNLRKDYNNMKDFNNKFLINIYLYVLIVYGFNNQIRFNKKGDFNIPVGKRDFNENIKNNLILFVDHIKKSQVEFLNEDFRNINNEYFKNSFVYVDPPYLITNASYNEQGGWSEECEYELYQKMDQLNEKGIKFALSNVVENKGIKNHILEKWVNNNNYVIHYLDKDYNNSNYQIKDRTKKTVEVLITNY